MLEVLAASKSTTWNSLPPRSVAVCHRQQPPLRRESEQTLTASNLVEASVLQKLKAVTEGTVSTGGWSLRCSDKGRIWTQHLQEAQAAEIIHISPGPAPGTEGSGLFFSLGAVKEPSHTQPLLQITHFHV